MSENNQNLSLKTVAYKAPQVIVIFLVAIMVLSLDIFFLGIGLTMAILKSFRWATILVFVIKLLVDVAVFATWFYLVKEKADKYSGADFTVEDNKITVTYACGRLNCTAVFGRDLPLKIKQDFVRKFYGIYTVVITCLDKKYCYNFYSETKQSLISKLDSNK